MPVTSATAWRNPDEVALLPREDSVFRQFRSSLIDLCREHGIDVVRPPINVLARPSTFRPPAASSRRNASASPPADRTFRRMQRRLQKVQVHTYLSPVHDNGKLDDVWSDRHAAARGWAESFRRRPDDDAGKGTALRPEAAAPASLLGALGGSSLFITANSPDRSVDSADRSVKAGTGSANGKHQSAIVGGPEANLAAVYAANFSAAAASDRTASRSPARSTTATAASARTPRRQHQQHLHRDVPTGVDWLDVLVQRDLRLVARKASSSRRQYADPHTTVDSDGSSDDQEEPSPKGRLQLRVSATPTAKLRRSSPRRPTIADIAPPETSFIAPPTAEAEDRQRRQRELVRLRSRMTYEPPLSSISAMPLGVVGAPMEAAPHSLERPATYRAELQTRAPYGFEHRAERRASRVLATEAPASGSSIGAVVPGCCRSGRSVAPLSGMRVKAVDPPSLSQARVDRSVAAGLEGASNTGGAWRLAGQFTVPSSAVPASF